MNVNTKQFLSQAYKLNEQIECDKEELESLRSLAESVSGDMTQERVQISVTGDKIVNIISKIVDLENEIHDEIEELIDLKKVIRDTINKLENVNEKLVLKYRYLMFFQWDEICDKLNYSKRQIGRIHDSALENIEIPLQVQDGT